MPQVARDKRCFPLNKETVKKNTFVCEQVCVCGQLRMLVFACVRARVSERQRKLTRKLCC